MTKFIEEREREVLLILITMLAVTRVWMPDVTGFGNMYSASHWVLSYDHGLVRRGLVGTIIKWWTPIVSIQDVYLDALVAFVAFLLLLTVIFYALMKHKDKSGRIFRLILLFVAAPVTLSMFARDLGRFDLFLMMILCLSLILLSLRKYLWLIPVVMVVAMFIHEAFLVLCMPTILGALVFVYLRDQRERRILVTLAVSVISVAGAFLVLTTLGTPSLGYTEFSHIIQSRATFTITDLSMRECYYSVKSHFDLAVPYLQDPGSIVNYIAALLILSPVILILLNLWNHALENCGGHRGACWLFFLATLSGFALLPVGTDFGRWLSAVIFCNFFAVFFLISGGIIRVEELEEFEGGGLRPLFILLIVTYVLFGPMHDWNPFPYQHSIIYSTLSIVSVLLFDVVFSMRWRSLSAAAKPGGPHKA